MTLSATGIPKAMRSHHAASLLATLTREALLLQAELDLVSFDRFARALAAARHAIGGQIEQSVFEQAYTRFGNDELRAVMSRELVEECRTLQTSPCASALRNLEATFGILHRLHGITPQHLRLFKAKVCAAAAGGA